MIPWRSMRLRRRPLAPGDLIQVVVATATVALLIYLVIVPLFFLAFGSVFTGRPGQEGTLSLGAYAAVFSDERSYRLMGVTIAYAVGSSVISFAIGVTIAWLLQRTDIPGKRIFATIAIVPIFIPTVLSTIGWIFLLDANIGIVNTLLRSLFGGTSGPLDVYSFGGMMWIKGILDVPLVVLWMWPAFAAMDPSLEEAGAVSGSTPRRTLGTVTLPLARPALLAAFLISFISSLEDVNVAVLIGLPAGINVFSSEMYLAIARTPSDVHAASAYGVILLVIALLLTVVYRRLTLNTERFVTVRGRGYRPAVAPLGRMRTPAAIALGAFLFAVIVLPLILLFWMSINPYTRAPSVDALGSLTLRHYETLWLDERTLRGLTNSAILGAITAVLVMLMALVVGWIVVRTRSRFAAVVDLVAFAPIAIPGLVIAIALIWLYLSLPLPITIYGTATVLVIAYVTRFIPFGVRLSYAGFAQLHPELEEAAAMSGSSWRRIMTRISVPLLAPTLAVGAIYVFLRAFSELPVSLLLHSFGDEPFSVVVFHTWTSGETQKTAAYGVVAIVLMSIVIFAFQRLGGMRFLRQ